MYLLKIKEIKKCIDLVNNIDETYVDVEVFNNGKLIGTMNGYVVYSDPVKIEIENVNWVNHKELDECDMYNLYYAAEELLDQYSKSGTKEKEL